MEGPPPLRIGPSLAAVVLAIALGSLAMSACALQFQDVAGTPQDTAVVLFGAAALWMFAASCIYAANRQWMGRGRREQLERFWLCMLLAIPVFLAIALFGFTLYVDLGGRT